MVHCVTIFSCSPAVRVRGHPFTLHSSAILAWLGTGISHSKKRYGVVDEEVLYPVCMISRLSSYGMPAMLSQLGKREPPSSTISNLLCHSSSAPPGLAEAYYNRSTPNDSSWTRQVVKYVFYIAGPSARLHCHVSSSRCSRLTQLSGRAKKIS